jgi:hypothetical protein
MVEIDNNITCKELQKKIIDIVSEISDVSLLEKIFGLIKCLEDLDSYNDDCDLSNMPLFGPKNFEELEQTLNEAEIEYERKNCIPHEVVMQRLKKRIKRYEDSLEPCC